MHTHWKELKKGCYYTQNDGTYLGSYISYEERSENQWGKYTVLNFEHRKSYEPKYDEMFIEVSKS